MMASYTPAGGKTTVEDFTVTDSLLVEGPATLGNTSAPAGNVTVKGALEVNSTSILKGTILSQGNISHSGSQLGFFNHANSAQPAAIADATGGTTTDTEARTAINALLAAMRSLGLIAT